MNPIVYHRQYLFLRALSGDPTASSYGECLFWSEATSLSSLSKSHPVSLQLSFLCSQFFVAHQPVTLLPLRSPILVVVSRCYYVWEKFLNHFWGRSIQCLPDSIRHLKIHEATGNTQVCKMDLVHFWKCQLLSSPKKLV